jgi:predicted naringenin-chalcone synthase
MPASILSIGTALPPTRLPQQHVRDLFAAQAGNDRLTQRLVHAAFDAAAIDTRHTVLADLAPGLPTERMPGSATLPVIDAAGQLQRPSTGARNAAYVELAPPLFAAAARGALAGAAVDPAAVTHVVTVSCTGLFAPGPDYLLVRELGLPPSTERFHLGFVGCAAALPALRLADALCAARPDAVVLVVCAELCTLHFRPSTDPEQIVAASVFADGAAAAVVTSRDDLLRAHGGPRLALDRFATTVTSEGERDMVWTIGDTGFEMTLSAEVPRIIGREIRSAVDSFIADATPHAWAVHPGGRSVLDRVESGLDLPSEALRVSRRVLRDNGNMSSATILFILAEMLAGDDAVADDGTIAALAFGPGLTVESAMLTRHGAAQAPHAAEAPHAADLARPSTVPAPVPQP